MKKRDAVPKTKIGLALGIAILQSASMTAAVKGKFPIRQNIAVAPRDPDPQQTKSGPLSYVLSPTPDYTATMFGVLDVGMGKFYPISTTPTIGLGIGKDARSRL